MLLKVNVELHGDVAIPDRSERLVHVALVVRFFPGTVQIVGVMATAVVPQVLCLDAGMVGDSIVLGLLPSSG